MEDILIVKQKLNASIEKVWDALTDKKAMKKWYFDIPNFTLELNRSFTFYEPGTEKKFLHQCEVLEVIHNQKLSHSWSYPEFSHEKTIVTWELIPDDEGTQLMLKHTGLEKFATLDDAFSRENFEKGWKTIIGKSLREFVEA